jgi:hypothetical protein
MNGKGMKDKILPLPNIPLPNPTGAGEQLSEE